MHYNKHEVRRYVVRTQLFALPDPRRNAEALAALGRDSAKSSASAPAPAQPPRTPAAKE